MQRKSNRESGNRTIKWNLIIIAISDLLYILCVYACASEWTATDGACELLHAQWRLGFVYDVRQRLSHIAPALGLSVSVLIFILVLDNVGVYCETALSGELLKCRGKADFWMLSGVHTVRSDSINRASLPTTWSPLTQHLTADPRHLSNL